jgi:hypothetical protein
MSDGQSRDYFERRAEQEQIAAEQATGELAARRHREMAEHYRKLMRAGGPGIGKPVESPGNGILPKDFRLIP